MPLSHMTAALFTTATAFASSSTAFSSSITASTSSTTFIATRTGGTTAFQQAQPFQAASQPVHQPQYSLQSGPQPFQALQPVPAAAQWLQAQFSLPVHLFQPGLAPLLHWIQPCMALSRLLWMQPGMTGFIWMQPAAASAFQFSCPHGPQVKLEPHLPSGQGPRPPPGVPGPKPPSGPRPPPGSPTSKPRATGLQATPQEGTSTTASSITYSYTARPSITVLGKRGHDGEPISTAMQTCIQINRRITACESAEVGINILAMRGVLHEQLAVKANPAPPSCWLRPGV